MPIGWINQVTHQRQFLCPSDYFSSVQHVYYECVFGSCRFIREIYGCGFLGLKNVKIMRPLRHSGGRCYNLSRPPIVLLSIGLWVTTDALWRSVLSQKKYSDRIHLNGIFIHSSKINKWNQMFPPSFLSIQNDESIKKIDTFRCPKWWQEISIFCSSSWTFRTKRGKKMMLNRRITERAVRFNPHRIGNPLAEPLYCGSVEAQYWRGFIRIKSELEDAIGFPSRRFPAFFLHRRLNPCKYFDRQIASINRIPPPGHLSHGRINPH